MHRAVGKAVINSALSKNVLALSLSERDYLIRTAHIGSFRVPARAITSVASRSETASDFLRFKFNLINFSPVTCRPASVDPTFQFISEVVLEGRAFNQTSLYSKLVTDVKGRRRGSRRKSILTESDFAAYYQSCLRLIDSIKAHGVLDVENDDGPVVEEIRNIRSVWPNRMGDFSATTVGLAICDDGTLVHFTKGHHRLAIAQVLDVDQVPVAINYLSGKYFNRYRSRNCLLSEKRFLNALEMAAMDAIARVNK